MVLVKSVYLAQKASGVLNELSSCPIVLFHLNILFLTAKMRIIYNLVKNYWNYFDYNLPDPTENIILQ
jgi:hypothetical protein